MNLIKQETKVSKAIHSSPATILVLERFGVQLGFGDQTIRDLCVSANLRPQLFILINNLYIDFGRITKTDLNREDVIQLVHYLKRSHVYFLEEQIPRINQIIESELNTREDKNLRVIHKFYNDYTKEVKDHILYENEVVFPYILNLIASDASMQYSIDEYKHHHTDIEEKLEDLKNLLIKFLPEEFKMQVRRKIYFELLELEKDLGEVNSLPEKKSEYSF